MISAVVALTYKKVVMADFAQINIIHKKWLWLTSVNKGKKLFLFLPINSKLASSWTLGNSSPPTFKLSWKFSIYSQNSLVKKKVKIKLKVFYCFQRDQLIWKIDGWSDTFSKSATGKFQSFLNWKDFWNNFFLFSLNFSFKFVYFFFVLEILSLFLKIIEDCFKTKFQDSKISETRIHSHHLPQNFVSLLKFMH